MVRLVVMAAGQARRMGRDKLALPWKDSTVLASVLEAVLKASERLQEAKAGQSSLELRVVARKSLAAYLPDALQERFQRAQGTWCEDEVPRPLADTIRIGLQELADEIQGIAFLPGDQVGLRSDTLLRLVETFLHEKPDFLVPLADPLAPPKLESLDESALPDEPSMPGMTGSPVIFHRRYVPELLGLEGEQGGKTVLQRYKAKWATYPVETDFFADVDTPEQYSLLSGHDLGSGEASL
ncbi:MAG: NTP transferase domain-containing protein [Desulfitobacteriaceae bacterium]|nr:NTP transferase domain-containing protein [Desulfitobacteriaceae bacterium]MDI6913704.1 NTP transferase domain-containing protein [Desulfitobacteriaceae bacterium]